VVDSDEEDEDVLYSRALADSDDEEQFHGSAPDTDRVPREDRSRRRSIVRGKQHQHHDRADSPEDVEEYDGQENEEEQEEDEVAEQDEEDQEEYQQDQVESVSHVTDDDDDDESPRGKNVIRGGQKQKPEAKAGAKDAKKPAYVLTSLLCALNESCFRISRT
jgi:hypothetical protein